MLNWKALLTGIIAIIILGLTAQLVFVLVSGYYVEFLNKNPQYSGIGTIISYLLGIIGLFLVSGTGGYLAADVVHRRVLLHGALVGFIACGLSMVPMLYQGALNLNGVIFIGLGTGFSAAGALIWQRMNPEQAGHAHPG